MVEKKEKEAETKPATQSDYWRDLFYGTQALNSLSQGAGAYFSSRFNASSQNNNAAMLEMQGKDALLRGADRERAFRIEGRKILGTQRAATAENGFDVNAGTSLDLFGQTSRIIENDALAIRQNAQNEKIALNFEAAQNRIQSRLSKNQGRTALVQGILNAGSSALAWKAGI